MQTQRHRRVPAPRRLYESEWPSLVTALSSLCQKLPKLYSIGLQTGSFLGDGLLTVRSHCRTLRQQVRTLEFRPIDEDAQMQARRCRSMTYITWPSVWV